MRKCTKVTFGSEEGTTPSSGRRMERRSLAESSLAQFGISFSRMLRLHEFSGLDKRRRSHSAECRLTLSSFLRPLMLQFALRYLVAREENGRGQSGTSQGSRTVPFSQASHSFSGFFGR